MELVTIQLKIPRFQTGSSLMLSTVNYIQPCCWIVSPCCEIPLHLRLCLVEQCYTCAVKHCFLVMAMPFMRDHKAWVHWLVGPNCWNANPTRTVTYEHCEIIYNHAMKLYLWKMSKVQHGPILDPVDLGLDPNRTWTGPIWETLQYSKIKDFFFINNIHNKKVLYKILSN